MRWKLSISVALGMLMMTGCFHLAHPRPEVCQEVWRPSDELPVEAKNCVFVFIFNGPDMLGYCNMNGVKEYVNEIGFVKTYYGLPVHKTYFAQKLELIANKCDARFAIIGFDTGAEAAAELGRFASIRGIPIDFLMMIEPRGTGCLGTDFCENVITVRGDCRFLGFNCHEVGNVVILPETTPCEAPTHQETLNIIERELTLIGMGVPIVPRKLDQKVPLVERMPAPRNKTAQPKRLQDEWRYLRPSGIMEELNPLLPTPKLTPQETIPAPREVEPKNGAAPRGEKS